MGQYARALLLGAAFSLAGILAIEAAQAGPAAATLTAAAVRTITLSGKSSASTAATNKAAEDIDAKDQSDDDADETPAKIVLPPGRQEMLYANNALRAELGLSKLVWSRHLAHTARLWAKHLAVEVHALVHSHTEGMGENLSMASSGYKTPGGLVNLWADEKPNFVHAAFPNVAKAGDWTSVGHYTQVVWRNTVKVGCGIATDDKSDYLVCEYSPQGNVMGEAVY